MPVLKTLLSLVVCLSIAGPAFAQDSAEALAKDAAAAERALWDSSREMKTFRAGTSTLKVQAEKGVDLDALIIAAKIKPNDAPDVVINKVDVVRLRLYPDKEIALSASVPKTIEVDPAKVTLWRYYIYWNRGSSMTVWGNPLGAAVTFLGRVRGTWWYYECNKCTKYVYRASIGTGGSYTRVFSGGWHYLGFSFSPRTYGARADVIVYFFY